MGKTLTRSIGVGFALALAGATFSPAMANAETNGEDSVPRVATISDAVDPGNELNEISIEVLEDEDGNFTESLEISSTNIAEPTADGGVDWHCRSFLSPDGTVSDTFEEFAEAGWNDNLLSGANNNNHGTEIRLDTLDTSDLEDGTYTVASACFGGIYDNVNEGEPEAAGTQDFTLSTPASGSLEGIGLGSLEGGSLEGGSSDSLSGGSDAGSVAPVGSLVLGGGIAAAIHAHNVGMF